MVRPVYGASMAYIIRIMAENELSSDPISKTRPSWWIGCILSLKLWIPFSRLSYSIYLWHVMALNGAITFFHDY